MIGLPSICRVSRPAPIAALLLLALSLATPPVQAGEPIAVQSALSAEDPLAARPMAVLPFAADRYGWLWTLLENTLNNRARMIQFGLVGVAIALYIMFRARG
jgi:hypothetical protein